MTTQPQRLFLLLAALVVTTPSVAAAQVTELWVARYHGPVAGSSDGAQAIALDAAGNLYVTGTSQGVGTGLDYATVAYDCRGNELWEARYNGPGIGDDVASGIAIDSNTGNVYVTGRSQGVGTGADYATVAYDPSGNQLWEARYNGPANRDDIALAIAVDASSGNVYVTGQSQGLSTTVAYDSGGNQLWVAVFDPPNTTSSITRAIAVDASSGNVYVTGGHLTSGSGQDFATVAYDSAGNQLWADVVFSDSLGFYAIAVGNTGNVYVTGFERHLIPTEYTTFAYSTTGTRLWSARYFDPLGNGIDQARAIAVDSTTENVYVTGLSRRPPYNYYATVAYDSTGHQRWVARYIGVPDGIAVDSNTGNVYVTGYSPGVGTASDYGTVAYDSSGNELWEAHYNGNGNGNDIASGIAVDSSSGNVYVTGQSQSVGSGSDYATVAYSITGTAAGEEGMILHAIGAPRR
jgi:hypothetical protein